MRALASRVGLCEVHPLGGVYLVYLPVPRLRLGFANICRNTGGPAGKRTIWSSKGAFARRLTPLGWEADTVTSCLSLRPGSPEGCMVLAGTVGWADGVFT